MMKICIFVRILWAGGVQRIAFAEAEQLSSKGHSVDLIFLRKVGNLTYNTAIPYTVVYEETIQDRLSAKLLQRITRIYAPERGKDATVDLDLIRKFERRRQDYDVIIYFDQHAAFFAKYGRKKHKGKIVVYIHETSLKGREGLIPHFVDKRALKHASAILTHSKFNQDVLSRFGYKNIYLIYPGTDTHEQNPPFEQRDDMALSVTMWDWGRKPEVLLNIAEKMNEGQLVLAGSWTDREYMEDFKRQVKEKNLEKRLIVTGPLEEELLKDYYRHAKVVIRFGYNEAGPGMGSLEGISYGIPLIINSGIGIKEVVEEGKHCFVVDEKEPIQIVEKLNLLFNDSKTWERISRNNIALSKELSWENHGLLLESILKSVVEKPTQAESR